MCKGDDIFRKELDKIKLSTRDQSPIINKSRQMVSKTSTPISIIDETDNENFQLTMHPSDDENESIHNSITVEGSIASTSRKLNYDNILDDSYSVNESTLIMPNTEDLSSTVAPNTSFKVNELTALMPNNVQDLSKVLLELAQQMYVLTNTVNELKSNISELKQFSTENSKINKKSGDVSVIKEVVSLTILSFYFSIKY